MDETHRLVTTLQNGGVAVIPTDTLYGIVASAFNPAAVEQVYSLRRRTPTKPCIILISDTDQLTDLGITVSVSQREIMTKYWPGPVSLIFSTGREDLSYLHRGSGNLAVRLPDSADLRQILRSTGPLIAPSANHEGQPPATTVSEARAYFGEEVQVYMDKGRREGNPSGLIDLTGPTPVIVRPLQGQ